MIDSHIHSNNSHDGRESIENLVRAAIAKGVSYFAITEHYDRDCPEWSFPYIRQLDLPAYQQDFLRVQKLLGAQLDLRFGIECGFSSLCSQTYAFELPKYDFDVIINSVHIVDGEDPYQPIYYKNRTREQAYLPYLETIRQSLFAEFDFDIVGHIGYVSRYAPYADPTIVFDKSVDIIDDILQTIINKDKTLEVNANVKGLGLLALPEPYILKRYRELGGENITYGSDAHVSSRICENYAEICRMLADFGYKYLTIYKQRKPCKILI